MKSTTKELSFNIKVRVFGQGLNTSSSHGYCVDDMPLGISSVIGELNIDCRTMTLCQLRPLIQYNRSGHMDKRSMMFQEALFIMSKLPNYYNRPVEELIKYQFGFVKKDLTDVKLVHSSRENDPIGSLIGAAEIFGHDLIIVPLSQIPPELTTELAPALSMQSSKLDNNEAQETTPISSPMSRGGRSRNSRRAQINAARAGDASNSTGLNISPERRMI